MSDDAMSDDARPRTPILHTPPAVDPVPLWPPLFFACRDGHKVNLAQVMSSDLYLARDQTQDAIQVTLHLLNRDALILHDDDARRYLELERRLTAR